MEVVPVLKKLTSLPVTQGENLPDVTCNLDKWVEVHAILKAHAVNLEKIVSDLRLLSSGVSAGREIQLPSRQVGSSIMPGKVNPVVPEYIISTAHRIYTNDQLITSLAAQGCLDLNAYLPEIGSAMIESLKLLIAMNRSLGDNLLDGIRINEKPARERLFRSPAITTALSPFIGYNQSEKLAKKMKETGDDVFSVNRELNIVEESLLERLMVPEFLLKQGFTMKDIREVK